MCLLLAFYIKDLCYYIASYTIQLVTIGYSVSFYLIFTVDKSHHGLNIAPFSGQVLKFLLQLFQLRWGLSSNQSFLLLLMAMQQTIMIFSTAS